jgi:hypothetical protein
MSSPETTPVDMPTASDHSQEVAPELVAPAALSRVSMSVGLRDARSEVVGGNCYCNRWPFKRFHPNNRNSAESSDS